MSKTTVGLIAFLVLLAIAVGLYATGPKYVVETHTKVSFGRIYCQNGSEQKRRQITNRPHAGVAYSAWDCRQLSDAGIGCAQSVLRGERSAVPPRGSGFGTRSSARKTPVASSRRSPISSVRRALK